MSIDKYIIVLLSILLFSSCSDDEKEYKEQLKEELIELLQSKSPSGSLNHYRIPRPSFLDRIPQDPLNPLTAEKIELGKMLFHETGIGIANKSSEGFATFSCASCHQAGAGFQAGVAQGVGEGGLGFGIKGEARVIDPIYSVDSVDIQPIRTPTILNSAFQTNMLWNGQFGATGINRGTEENWTVGTPKEVNELGYEGVESQAIGGMSVHRLDVNEEKLAELGYKEMFDSVYPDLPKDKRYNRETAGLAIAAYERTVLSNEAPFQKWLIGQNKMSSAELEGAILFFDKAGCDNCHSGPALNDMSFHALGMLDLDAEESATILNPMNPESRGRGGFTNNEEDNYKFKVPQLYNLKGIEFLGHGSSFNTIEEVLEYKNSAIPENSKVNEEQLSVHFVPLGLSEKEIESIALFISESLYDDNLERYVPLDLPSGNCFPNADDISKIDLNCN